jgi:hypothetical protein
MQLPSRQYAGSSQCNDPEDVSLRIGVVRFDVDGDAGQFAFHFLFPQTPTTSVGGEKSEDFAGRLPFEL